MDTDLRSYDTVHFVGIGGIGMSALARHLLTRGVKVSGSDRDPGEQGAALTRLGIPVFAGHEQHYVENTDLVVVTSAVRENNPEVARARALGIPVVKRAELLAAIMNAGRGIAIAGTHGKTTTSALVAHILVEADLDPTILIGGISANLGSNARSGGDLVVVEADEYDGSFLRLRPAIGVITNVEPDHLDFYGSFDRIKEAFEQFACSVTERLIVCADDPWLPELAGAVSIPVATYGLEEGSWRASHIHDRDGSLHFTVSHASHTYDIHSTLAGRHNVQNILAALAVADALNVPLTRAVSAVAGFTGVARRFDLKGFIGDSPVLDDYAHHPSEIRTNLAAMKERYGRPIRVVFQPHTYSRTRSLLGEFSEAFGDADHVYLTDVYPARETDTLGIDGMTLAEAVRAHHSSVTYAPTLDDARESVLHDLNPGDLVVTMGAGDIYRVAAELVRCGQPA